MPRDLAKEVACGSIIASSQALRLEFDSQYDLDRIRAYLACRCADFCWSSQRIDGRIIYEK
jgi:hypothetical protein